MERKYDVEGSIAIAKFLKYGYPVLILVSLIIVYFLDVSKFLYYIPVGFLFIMSIHTIIAAYLFKDHYICFMQSMKHAVMDPAIKYDEFEIKKMKKEGIITGLIFFVLGIIFAVLIIV